MLIEEIGDRRERWFQDYSLPQQLPIGEAELRIGGSRHGSIVRLFRRHLPLALQSLHVPRCGLVQQFLKGAPVVQTAPNLPAPVLLECKPKSGVPCDDRTTRNSGAVHQIGKPGNSPVCTGSDAGSASREWLAIGPPTDPPTSALHPQVIRSCALACVA